MNLFDLSGKTAIVTGGSQGIGLAISEGMAAAGATIIIANRRTAEGQKAVEYLNKKGLKALSFTADVSSLSSISVLVSKVIEAFGKIDILVNSAGVILRKPPELVTEEDWDYVMNINLKGLFFTCQTVGKEMMRSGGGKIINVSSIVSQIAHAGRSVYVTSKAGVSHLTRALALEWAKYNINVNAIGPAATLSPLSDKYFKEHEEERTALTNCFPKGRMGCPNDYVGTAIFLASSASDFITGQTIMVDGGFTLAR